MNESESDAMWKLYGNPAGETVAIKTNVGRLKKSLENSAIVVFIGKIMYEENNIPEGNLYFPVLHKRKPFQHEEELRSLTYLPQSTALRRPRRDNMNSRFQNPQRHWSRH